MITFAPTTRRQKRFGTDATAEDKVTHLERLRQGLQIIDDNTERVDVDTLRGATLDHEGIMSGYRFSKEGFSNLCSKLSGHTFSFLQGIDQSDMGIDSKRELQTKIFNDLWRARSHELDGCKFLVDSTTNKIEAVHSKSYGYLSNSDSLQMMVNNLGTEEVLSNYKVHGRSLNVEFEDPSQTFKMPTKRAPDGETITAIKYIQNSEDGSSRFTMGMGCLYFYCSNGMKLGVQANLATGIHKSGIIESIRSQLITNKQFDMSGIFSLIENSTRVQFTDELRGKAYSFLKDQLGITRAKKFVSDEVAFRGGDVPSLFESFSALTEDAHAGGYSIRDQSDMELTGFKYLQKFAQVA
jgi:hypothetical protein